nr:MAG TPA: hypothetical protein [Caudoviricetes sp.]
MDTTVNSSYLLIGIRNFIFGNLCKSGVFRVFIIDIFNLMKLKERGE